ncbi:MAG: hypothetical protein Q4G58_07310 [bacterium]|nr:hypothetical protein [bacterium]
MDEIYAIIESKIKESGFTGEVNGYEIYNEICDFMDDKENGSYIFLSKKADDIVFEYKVDINDDDFNLSYVDIKEKDNSYHIDFDA